MASIKNYLRKILPPRLILWGHKIRAIIAAYYYGFPAKRLKVIGVTGTNGKTTTCHLIAKILEEAGYKVGLATTINFRIGAREWVNTTKMTTVSPFALQKLLREMVREGCHSAVIETTSHAISQYRNWGIKYDAAALTNITHEHLDYHKTLEGYRATKLKLFQNVRCAILNKDDRSYDYFKNHVRAKQISYGIQAKADVAARKVITESTGSLFTLVTPQGQLSVNLSLPGRFNIYNALAAASLAVAQDINPEIIKKSLEDIHNIAGRMEKIDSSAAGRKLDFMIMIDYAHTPDAFEKIYEALRPVIKKRIIHVFGACGERDKTKRPIMGAIAGRHADCIILTNEDPYNENSQAIIEQIAKGVPRGTVKNKPKKEGRNFFKILDRREAIKKALALAKKDDLVLITGKGAERSMVVGDKKIPWSDQETVRALLV